MTRHLSYRVRAQAAELEVRVLSHSDQRDGPWTELEVIVSSGDDVDSTFRILPSQLATLIREMVEDNILELQGP